MSFWSVEAHGSVHVYRIYKLLIQLFSVLLSFRSNIRVCIPSLQGDHCFFFLPGKEGSSYAFCLFWNNGHTLMPQCWNVSGRQVHVLLLWLYRISTKLNPAFLPTVLWSCTTALTVVLTEDRDVPLLKTLK